MTAAGIEQRRMAAWKHGLRASVVTDDDARRYQFGPELQELLEQYARETVGGLSAADLKLAVGMAWKMMVWRHLLQEIYERGLAIEEPIFNSERKKVGVRVKANPLLKALDRIGWQLGYTLDQQSLSCRSLVQAIRESPAVEALRRARMRVAEVLGEARRV
jgi:hypothetical protein